MTPDLRERLEQYFSHRAPDGILAAYLFGSRALERDVPESDVDVGVVLDPTARFGATARFEIRLRLIGDLIHALGENEVDVVILNEIPAPFAAKILREGVRVHVTDPERAREFERDILLRAADLIPFLRRARQAQLERLSR